MTDALGPRSTNVCRNSMDDATDPRPPYALFPATLCFKGIAPEAGGHIMVPIGHFMVPVTGDRP